MLFTDRWFLARSSQVEMNAALGGGLTAFLMGTFFFGILGQVNCLAGQYSGARRPFLSALTCGQGMYLSLLFTPLLLMTIPFAPALFSACGHKGELLQMELAYFNILTWGHAFTLMRTTLASFFCGVGRSAIVMKASFAGVALNIPFSYALVNGAWGMPKMGIAGAAWATVVSNLLVLIILLVIYFSPALNRAHRTRKSLTWHWASLKKLLRYGIPSGFEFFAMLSGFNAFILFFQSAGDTTAAALTITFSYELLAFLPMTGIQIAVAATAGKHMGSGRPDLAHKTAYAGLKIAWCYSFSMVMLFLLFADPLCSFFSNGEQATATALAAVMLRIACAYIPADAAHLVFSGVLKGAGDVVWPSLIAAITFWGAAIICWFQVNKFHAHPYTIWSTFAGIMLCMSALYYWRFKQGKWQSLKMIGK